MASLDILSPRMRDTVAGILPRVMTTVAQRSSENIDLVTAENWLIRPELETLYKEACQDRLTCDQFSYAQGFGGDPALLLAAAKFFNNYFDPCAPVSPEHIVATPGATLGLDALLFSICNEGDIALVPAPYWNGFDFHFTLRPKVKIVPVVTRFNLPIDDRNTNILQGSLLSALDEAYNTIPDKSRIRVLVMTNPHNPFAQCYRRADLEDELYALSNFQRMRGSGCEGVVPFTSALSLPCQDSGLKHNRSQDQKSKALPWNKVHVIWSLSKDLGSSGLRLGFLVCQDPSCKALLASVYVLSTIHTSCLSSIAGTHLLSSSKLPSLLALATSRLSESHQIARARFRKWGTPYIQPSAGPYVTVQLIKRAQTVKEENEGIAKINGAGVLLAPLRKFGGWRACFDDSRDLGWVRMTVAVPMGKLLVALDKIGYALGHDGTK